MLKLIRQAGDRVLVFYERPVGYNQHGSALQDGFGQLEDTAFLPPAEDDQNSLTADTDSRDFDSEFEELACDSPDQKEDLPTAPSPKRSVVVLAATKPLGTISPILNRKLHLGNYQAASKTQQKDGAKVAAPKTVEVSDTSQPLPKQSQGSSTKPPVPPRPQIKPVLPTSDSQNTSETGGVCSDKPERPPPPANNGEKPTEKIIKISDPIEDPAVPKVVTAPKQDTVKEGLTENARSCKDNDDHRTWESPEIPYKIRQGRWPMMRTSSCLFEVEKYHKYLNVALWCRDPFKAGGFICLGYASIKLEEIALDCLATSSMEFVRTFKLDAPTPKAAVTRTALRSLTTHKGFNEKFCYGDVTLQFKYLKEGEIDDLSVFLEKEREYQLEEEARALQKEDPFSGQVLTENRHNFQDTQFQNPTWCDYCKKKVWTKAASQCMLCAYVCHKKCLEKCLTETPFCVGAEKRLDRTAGSSRTEGQEAPTASSSRADSEAKSVNRTTGLTRHIINTSSRLLNLRQVPKARLAEQGPDTAEPSPKHTPNTSDNESSDTELSGPSSPSKRAGGGGGGIKLVRKEGGLDDSVFIAVKEIGRDLYRSLPTEERFQKLEFMLDKLQNEIDQELENNNSLVKEEKETTDARKKALISAALAKSGERLQALTLLMIHYRAGIEDLESLENMFFERQSKKVTKDFEEPIIAEEVDSEDGSLTEAPTLNIISEEEPDDPPQSVD